MKIDARAARRKWPTAAVCRRQSTRNWRRRRCKNASGLSPLRRRRISRGSRRHSRYAGTKPQCYLMPKSAYRTRRGSWQRIGRRCRGSFSSWTFTSLLKSICRGHFITASSRMDRVSEKNTRHFHRNYIRSRSGSVHLIRRKKIFWRCCEKWDEWKMTFSLKYLLFRIFGIKASIGKGLLNLGWKLQQRDSTHDQFLPIICYPYWSQYATVSFNYV